MAEDKVEPREINWRQLLPWTELFRGFQVALDLNKLLLAAAGIVVMAIGWWFLSVVFIARESGKPPDWSTYLGEHPIGPQAKSEEEKNAALRRTWEDFRQAHDHWNLMQESAGITSGQKKDVYDFIQAFDDAQKFEDAKKRVAESQTGIGKLKENLKSAGDELASVKLRSDDSPDRQRKVREAEKKWEDAKAALDQATRSLEVQLREAGFSDDRAAKLAAADAGQWDEAKPYARLSTMPWFEDRGPNPFLLVTGQTGKQWEVGHFWEWFFTQQAPVLVEPVVKLLRPIIYFFSPGADLYTCFYFLLMLLWMAATWSLFGGAITRIAVVQIARGEKIGLVEAVRFTLNRLRDYLAAPLFPIAFVVLMLLVLIVFGGIVQLIPVLGDLWSGLLWGVWIVVGLLMAVALVGLVGWPLMAATISAEGTDSWEAVSRAFSYVFQKPWNFVWYSLVALAYGAVIVFFVGFMGSFAVYLTKWGVSQTPFIGPRWTNREPSYLFVYAPTSFGWRTLLLQGAKVDGDPLVTDGAINQAAYNRLTGFPPEGKDYNGPQKMAWWNHVGAFLVSVWLYLIFLVILGFSYSYFWTASTIIYLLLRKNVDAAELDEVYLEEDDQEAAFGGPLTPAAPATAEKPGTTSLAMVEPPRPAAPPPHAETGAAPPTPTPSGDGGPKPPP
jgi:hypothetical protein